MPAYVIVETLEGDWHPKRLALLEFEDLEAVRPWYHSAEYREARRLRAGHATLQIVAVEGLPAGVAA